MQQSLNDTTRGAGRRQLLGRRLDSEPYYAIVEQSADRLVLESRPNANRRDASGPLVRGGVLAALTLLILCAGFAGGVQTIGFGGLALLIAIAGLLGGFSLNGLAGGVAIISTRNGITLDAASQTITYTQSNRLVGERTQVLSFDEVAGLELRSRVFARPAAPSRRYPVVSLEFALRDGPAWLIDSAADVTALDPLIAALQSVGGFEVEDRTTV